MLFNSIEFLVFLPIVFCLYWFIFKKNNQVQNAFVVLASYFFYGWWDWRFLILIAITSFCSWYSGILIDKNICDGNKKIAKAINITNIILNLIILGFFKYYNFFIESFFDIFPSLRNDQLLVTVILPVGISFYTFQALSYSIDVYREKIKPTKNVIAFFAFVSFFPQLVAGPIERATNLLPQFLQKRKFDYATATDGCRQMLWGFFKKMVVADNCALFVDQVWNDIYSYNGSTLFIAAVLFSFQIYCDFSGYSDIAIGTAKLFGIQLKRNFNVPYFSRDIAEFWRRWHISLTTWFRDYIYIPLGGSRVGKWKVVRNTFVIFLVSGFWHGANWTFILWGAFHALLFLPLILMGKNRRYNNTVASGKLLPSAKEFFQIALTFILATIGWIIFRADSFEQICLYFKTMLNGSFFTVPQISINFVYIIILLIVEWITRERKFEFDIHIKNKAIRYIIYYAIGIACVLLSTQQENFIYFQF